ncbi:MAG: LytR family transcriptional regulator [Myxococcales bacterium]|nr:MAG: LytR family transcriptional regulator [Myxococcales bacterium]
MALAIGWALLLIDAWRLGNPPQLLRQQRLAMTGLNGVLVFGVAGALLFASHLVTVQKDFISTMFGGKEVSSATDGRYNILLLGGDSGATRWGMRPDSINVASIDEETGETILFGLPRNMTNFKFAKGSVMAEQFPDGYNCGAECELNSLATWAADHPKLFTGSESPGVQATTDAVEGITGLKINYYAMVNMQGFKKLVNAVGGLKLNVLDRIPMGGGNDVITDYIEPGVHTLNGRETLWFARSRKTGDDYARMARQKCVMTAMLTQLKPQKVLMSFEDIAKASTELISTSVPQSELDTFIDLALKARSKPVKSVSFVPPAIHTSNPDLAKIRSMVDKAIDPPKKSAKRKKSAGNGAVGTTGGSRGSLSEGYVANESADVGSAC